MSGLALALVVLAVMTLIALVVAVFGAVKAVTTRDRNTRIRALIGMAGLFAVLVAVGVCFALVLRGP